jgi:hypothetical protein
MNQREKAAHDKAAFLKELHACGDWAKASQRINRPRNTTNGWRRSDVTFRKETEKVLSIWKGTEGVKRCRKCRAVQDISEFAFRSERQSYRSICKGCKRIAQKERYNNHRTNSWFKLKCTRARSRSQHIRIPFDLTPEYLESIWTGFCPVTGIELLQDVERTHPQLAEIDRMIPELGYVQGNVTFMSTRMNRLKNDATLNELQSLCDWLKQTKGEQNVS